ncbi:MAG: hypothetical protein ACOY32_11480 [Thermodesulfobacteriota bacterium]
MINPITHDTLRPQKNQKFRVSQVFAAMVATGTSELDNRKRNQTNPFDFQFLPSALS